MFEALTDKFGDVFRRLSGRGRITEQNVEDAMREVRQALPPTVGRPDGRIPRELPQIRRGLWLALLSWLCALGLGGAGSAGAEDGRPNLERIAKTAQQSLTRLESSAAAWTCEFSGYDILGRIVAKVVWTPRRRRTSVWLHTPRLKGEIFRIIERGGIWYVIERGRALGKYRPYEAPLAVPTGYHFLAGCDVRFVVDVEPLRKARHESTRRGVAAFRIKLPPEMRRRLRALLKQMDQAAAALGPKATADVRQKARAVRDRLARGDAVEVDLATGAMTRYEWGNVTVRVSGFRWLQSVDEKSFDVSRRRWKDRTSDPVKGADLNDLAMMAHCGAWRPGVKNYELDGRLINVKTGRFRRIPYRGSVCLPGCFLKPRTRVVVSGLDTETGSLGLFEIDLSTGANRRLGGDALSAGACLMPVLSPDGKTLAVLHKDFSGGTIKRALQCQVYLVDVAAGTARKLGRPLDTAFLSWLPDGKGLILISRKYVGMDKPAEATICRMDLKGNVTPIRPGDHPVLLADGAILFQGRDNLWRTCDLAGENVRLFAGGMKGYASPSPGPDGKRIMWVRVRPPLGPRPVVLGIGSRQPRAVTPDRGLWGRPAWR